MNANITLKNVASYKEETTITADKKINLIYGLNGTGKTILSNYLYRNSKEEEDLQYRDCSNNFDPDVKVLVYNEQFIEDNFYEKDKIKGIFTLSTANKEAEENIKRAIEALTELNTEEENIQRKLGELNKEINNKKRKIQDTIWEIKTEYTGGDRLLDYCLHGLKTPKSKLLQYLQDIPNPDKKPQETIEQLKDELRAIKKGNKIHNIDLNNNTEDENSNIEDEIYKIEQNDLFKELIIGRQDSPLSELIKRLENSDWVKKGLAYLPESTKEAIECPFCQEKTITETFINNIKKYFDQSYEDKINTIRELKTNYEDFKKNLQQFKLDHQSNQFISQKKHEFDKILSELQSVLERNLTTIDNKIQNPSQQLNLDSSKTQIEFLIQFIDRTNKEIEKHNQKIADAEKEKERIKKIFWQIMHSKYEQTIKTHKSNTQQFNEKLKDLETEQTNNRKDIQNQKHIISENQKKTVNLETAVNNINRNLEEIGITDFKIKKQSNEESYFLRRNSSNNAHFKSLSEGEKTVISFLYFLELCEGRIDKEEVFNKKIVVIDDPISSLSHIYIFNVAQFIRNNFLNNHNDYEKIFILTHGLYFFHEIINLSKNKKEERQLFRITKNPSSQVKEMKENDIKNDYESYWEILKEYQSNGNNNPMLPNVMRNILEHFFGFVSKSELNEEIEKLDKQKYGAFIRYMNRESHSDRRNINDIIEIDNLLFLNAFKEVFKRLGYIKHYDKMMKT